MKFIRVGKSLVNLDLVSYIKPEEDGTKTKFYFTAGIEDFTIEDESFQSVLNKMMLMEAF